MLVDVLPPKIDAKMCQLVNQSNENGKRGKINVSLHNNIKKLSLVREFLPRWSYAQVEAAQCWLRNEFAI